MSAQAKYTEFITAIVCPQCGADAGVKCVSANGKAASVPHRVRVTTADAEQRLAESRKAEKLAEIQARADKEREAKVNRAKDNMIALRNGTADPYGRSMVAPSTDEQAEAQIAKAKAKAEAAATAQTKADAAPKARAKNSHVNCTHPRTHEGRVACRKARKAAAAAAAAQG